VIYPCSKVTEGRNRVGAGVRRRVSADGRPERGLRGREVSTKIGIRTMITWVCGVGRRGGFPVTGGPEDGPGDWGDKGMHQAGKHKSQEHWGLHGQNCVPVRATRWAAKKASCRAQQCFQDIGQTSFQAWRGGGGRSRPGQSMTQDGHRIGGYMGRRKRR